MRLLAKIVGGLPFLALAVPAFAQPEIEFDYEAFTLDNGLQVILVEEHSAPVVAVDVWYAVGGAHDPEGRSGFAHLFEHMMFQGTANLTKDELLRLVDDAGGNYNAYTARDHTAFHETLPAHQLPLGLWLEADRMASLAVTQTNLDNQRAVVIQEYQQNYSGAPYGMALRALYSQSYSYEPYRRSPIGEVDDVNAATVEEIADFHATYYVPNNATLAVVGDFDADEARALIEQFFGPIPAGDEPPELPDWQPEQQAEAEIQIIEDSLIALPATLIGYEIPEATHPDAIALRLLTTILSTGDSSRLEAGFVDTGIALVANTFVNINPGPGLFGVVMVPAGVTRDELEALIQAEFDDIIANGVTQEELDKAAAQIRSRTIVGMETVLGLAEEVQSGWFNYGDPASIVDELALLAAVTPEDISHAAAEWLAPEDRHVYRVDPMQGAPTPEPTPFVGATGTPEDDAFEIDFALPYDEPPEPLDVSEFDFPPVTQTVLPNGLEVVIIEAPELPVVSIDIAFRGGVSATDNPAMAPLAAELLTRGTGSMTAQEMADLIESRGGASGAYATNDLMGVGVFALVEDRELAFDVLADMVFDPAFPEAEIANRLGQMAQSLEASFTSPGSQVRRAFIPTIYGDHPYGGIVTLETLEAITRDGMMAFYESVARPDNALILVAGRVDADEALAMVEAHFADWEAPDEPLPLPDLPPLEDAAPVTMLVGVPGAQQAEVIVGNLGVTGRDPDRYALSVVNAVLGDGVSSRLNRLLREDLGVSYSVSSNLSFPVDRGSFAVIASVQPSAVAEAVTFIVGELERVREEAIPLEELAPVRDGMIGRFALNLETHQDFANTILAYWSRGLPIEDIGAYPERIADVTPESALAAAAALLPAEMVISVSGNAEILLPLLESIGPVVELEPR